MKFLILDHFRLAKTASYVSVEEFHSASWCSFTRQIANKLFTYDVPGTVLGVGNIAKSKTAKNCFCEAYSSEERET